MNISYGEVASKILETLFKRRKLLADDMPQTAPFSALPGAEIEMHLAKIEGMVSRQQPIHMILPAYPGKSPNRDKTLSKLPDLSEKHSLDNLSELCQEIEAIYPPGGIICICSDGYVFADLVRIADVDVLGYTGAIKDYCQQQHPGYFEFFDIKDAMPRLSSLDTMREELMVCYGESIIGLMEQVKVDKVTLSMYQGITRFLFEDFSGLVEFDGHSNTQIQKMAKQVSLRVIQRSHAWSMLLKTIYTDSLRLSIHPQCRQSEKIGIHMARADDCWRTPWHSVAVRKNQHISLQKRSDIDENKHRLIFNGGKPCHYREIFSQQEQY